jgi:sec-independent protein translocase protein TatB
MFDIGFWELALIATLSLIVLGPKRLPEAARFAGKWVARFRNMIATVKQDFNEHLKSEEMAELRQLKEELASARDSLNQSSSDLAQNFQNEMHAIEADEVSEADPEPEYLLKAIDDSATTGSTAIPDDTGKQAAVSDKNNNDKSPAE